MIDRSDWIWSEPYYSWINGYESLVQRAEKTNARQVRVLTWRALRPPLWKPGKKWPSRKGENA